MKKVLILYKFMPQYRIEFFEQLKEVLLQNKIELILIYGKRKDKNSTKGDERDLDWAIYRENKVLKIGNTSLIWQPCFDYIPKVDLVIVEQANSLMVNYVLVAKSKVSKLKFAFWGHGANLQDNENSLRNRFKFKFLNLSDHWFAYSEGVKAFLLSKGVGAKKISVVNNSIDTKTLVKKANETSENEVKELKSSLGIKGDNVGLYCGAIYKDKRLDFLIESSIKIKSVIEDFNLIIIGSGPDSDKIKSIASNYEWIHYVGPKFGFDRVPYFKFSKLCLMPGAIGLVVLDTFAMQVPLVTTDIEIHGPEIEYLIPNENGSITQNNLESYTEEVIELLQNKNRLEQLKSGCLESSKKYSTEDMVNNFKNGVLRCLEK